ncbi:MAG: DegT/DnrJ/EryC1/StrS family aminotransferase, partial [Terrisporobacter sp.]
MGEKIYLSSPHMCGEEMKYIQEAFDTNWIAPLGANVNGFEEDVCKYTGVKYAAALSSGTSAIHLGLKCLGVSKGDIVFCQSLTFSASCNPILYEGALPVFIDSDYETWNMSPVALKKAFQDAVATGQLPKAVVVVNLYGQSADYDSIRKICDEYKVPILEDAAESLGAKYKGIYSGTFGYIGVFSFNGNKIITTSGGGMMVSNNKEYTDKAIFWATQARDDAPYYLHSEVGYNYRISNVVAGIGRGQMSVIDKRVKQKKHIYDTYKEAFKDVEEIEMMPVYEEPNFWLSVITLSGDCEVSCSDVIEALGKDNIEARRVWNPMHLQPVFKDCKFFSGQAGVSVAEDVFNRGVCLPSDSKMSDEDLDRVIG